MWLDVIYNSFENFNDVVVLSVGVHDTAPMPSMRFHNIYHGP